MVCFFRASVAVFLLGFASVGVALIPAVCAAQGFLYAYSLLCFASGLGQDGFFLLPILFALRLMLVLPWHAAARQRRVGDLARSCGLIGRRRKAGEGRDLRKRYWSRFGSRVCVYFLARRWSCGSFHASCRFCCADLTEGGVPNGVRLSEAL